MIPMALTVWVLVAANVQPQQNPAQGVYASQELCATALRAYSDAHPDLSWRCYESREYK